MIPAEAMMILIPLPLVAAGVFVIGAVVIYLLFGRRK